MLMIKKQEIELVYVIQKVVLLRTSISKEFGQCKLSKLIFESL
jgi:hypothetical protein